MSKRTHSHASDPTDEHRISLAGAWRRSIEGAAVDLVPVPGGYPAVGECVLERSLDLDWPADSDGSRFFLVTEGVLSSAEFRVNGQSIGTAGPFATYRFEIPAALLRPTNTISARVCDVTETLGPTPGRCFEGGLVRDIWLESRPETFIESVAFRTEFTDDLSLARCCTEIALNGDATGQARVTLREKDTGNLVASLTADAREAIRFEVERPGLWSPERPDLYLLRVEFVPEGGPRSDVYEEAVGFRKIEMRGRDFYLNGARLLLKGVCRHDFTAQHGYTVPPEAIRRDLSMIEHAGFNFVRLVHAPHSRFVSQLAAEIGLLVTEEPGPCWHDLGDPAVAEPALESLRRTVLRDRNCPSVFAWSLYNECLPNVPYAVRAASICRELDPGCLITFADCHHQFDAVKEMMQAAELSYYGINCYSQATERYREIMGICDDRPLVFTEWGGWMALGNPRQMKLYCDTFVWHTREEAEARLAGCCFWAWADYDERSRGGPANVDGWTLEGLLDREGQARPDLQALSMMSFEMDLPPVRQAPGIEVLAKDVRVRGNWQPVSLRGLEGDQSHLKREVAAARSFSYVPPAIGRLAVAGIDFDCNGTLDECLVLLGPGREQVTIPVEGRVDAVAFLGHVALAGGYPSSTRRETGWGKLDRTAIKPRGAPASHYEFVFDDGSVSQQLAHGLHVLRGNLICHWWLTDPRSPELVPAVQIDLSPQFELLRLNLWQVRFDEPRYLSTIRWISDDVESVQALLAVSVSTCE